MASQAPSTRYTLASTETAFAILLPTLLASKTDSLRRIHDKSFTKWAAHINILYPSIAISHLPHAIPLIQNAVSSLPFSKLRVNLDDVGVFKHRKNATVYLKPDEESEFRLRELRKFLTTVLGCEESEGTVEGVFRPHLGVGQAAMLGSGIGNSIERLSEQARKVANLEWNCRGLVVLKREASGEMTVLEELRFGDGLDAIEEEEEEEEGGAAADEIVGLQPCFSFSSNDDTWLRKSGDLKTIRADNILISSYNIMAEPTADPFITRLPLIIEAIALLNPTSAPLLQVLTLQEVNDESLPLLLLSPYIRRTYPYCSHTASSLLPSARNLATLASKPFESSVVSFEERHKSALIVSFRFASKTLSVANVHLTSGLTNEAVKAKASQMEQLMKFLNVREHERRRRDVIVAGDFNLATSSRTIRTALDRNLITPATAQAVRNVIDLTLWEDAFLSSDFESELSMLGHDGQDVFEGEQGATFDRATNPIAAQLEPPIDQSPQRYDRVLFRKGGSISRDRFDIFGLADEKGRCGSDHYGVRAIFKFAESSSANDSNESARSSDASPSSEITIVEDATDLAPLIDPYLPSIHDISQREQAIQLLQSTLAKVKGLKSLIMAPLGSYLMGTYFPDSDVDLLAIGSVVPAVFFDFAGRVLVKFNKGQGEQENFKRVHFVNSLVSIVEVTVNGIKFDLQYCQAEELVRAYHGVTPTPSLLDLVFDKGLIATLSPSSIRPLNTYRDSAYLLLTIPNLPSYRVAHRYLTIYLKNRGLYSAKFGYLGGIHLQLLLNRVVKLVSISTSPSTCSPEGITPVSAATIVRTFFTYYSNFNWAAASVADPLLDPPSKVPRSARDAIFIPAIHIPTARPNVASSCTKLTAQTLSSQFSRLAQHLESGDWEWALQTKEACLADFMGSSGAFVRVGIDIWGIGSDAGEGEIAESKVRGMLGALESRFPRLLVSIGRIPGIEGRVWPARLFVSEEEEKGKEKPEEGQLKGYYLLGVSARDDMEKDSKQVMEGKLVTAVREFERGVLEAKEFVEGSKNVWLVVDVVKRKEVLGMNLVLDHQEWSMKNQPGRPSGALVSSLNLELDGEEEVALSSGVTAPTSTPSPHASQGSPKSSKAIKAPKTTPLRPAHEIIARIKWDPDLDMDNYLIGYEDRFVGVKEMPLGKWKSESTDEEFIPMHRVVWMRLKDETSAGNEGNIVWDRRRKIDIFFGSGVGAG
ncbi:uncharacterized protein RAG0_15436 [Rhynchosporium agropyri]|uniref:Uncharacterized protein n=1 Tax=Rhynchosporium agropyri TaxID=914238 RepID=A0A1E1LL69_9HELO|nr:uncharacterized protein RAG0_15436 [Rhynchosporium agropyri]